MGKVYKALNKALGSQEPEEPLRPAPETTEEADSDETARLTASLTTEEEPRPEKISVEEELSSPETAHPPTTNARPTTEPRASRAASQQRPAPRLADQDLFQEENTQEGSIENWDERLIKVTTSSPLVTEGVRRLRNKILHPPGDREIKSILVTSALPSEGKSFICANLGVNMAQSIDTHALMVDCDLRRPSLSSLFGIKNNSGLVDHLNGEVDLARLIRKTGQDKLSLLPSGPPPVNPAEMLGSERMVSLIKEMVERYDDRFIIFDSPPVQAAAETAVLARQVDAVLIVVRWGYSSRDLVRQLVDAIGSDKVLGVVFNAFEVNLVEKRLQKMKGYEGYYKYAKEY